MDTIPKNIDPTITQETKPEPPQVCKLTAECFVPDTDISTEVEPDVFNILTVSDPRSSMRTIEECERTNTGVSKIESDMRKALTDWLPKYLIEEGLTLHRSPLTVNRPSAALTKHQASTISREVHKSISSLFQRYAGKYGTGHWALDDDGLKLLNAIGGVAGKSVIAVKVGSQNLDIQVSQY